MRIRLFLIGTMGVIILTSIVILTLISLYKNKNKEKHEKQSFNLVTKIVALLLAIASSYAIFQMTFTFLQSKKVGYQQPNTVVIDGKTIKTEANAAERLILPMAYDTIEATHPSVANLPEKWHGYKYWMAITAYPGGDAVKENPHILASNDLIQWNIPEGLKNPLDKPVSIENDKDDRPKQYNSDTHIIYNEAEDRLEMFWRYVDDVNHEFIIYRMTSKDGSNWTKKEVTHSGDRRNEDWISPAFIKEGDLYKVWYVAKGFVIEYRESKDGFNWTDPTLIEVPYADKKHNMRHWHLDVQKFDDNYEMIVVGFDQLGEGPKVGERHIMNLYYSQSSDNIAWSALKPIIYPSQTPKLWDGKGIYRSAMIKEKGKYYVFYSGIGRNDTRGVGVSYGADIFKLHGLDYSDTSDFLK